MMHNLHPASVAPNTVFPKLLCTSFVVTRIYPLLINQYNDGTVQRSMVADGVNAPRVMRTWVLAQRLTTAQLVTLTNFWELTVFGGLYPFYFYDLTDVLPGQQHGSNWDATGGNPQGRATVFFRGDWGSKTTLGRSDVPSLTLIEVL